METSELTIEMTDEELKVIWGWYIEQVLGDQLDMTKGKEFKASQSLERLWHFNDVFTPRHDAIRATPYSKANDPEADIALVKLAETGTTEAWSDISAGAWRVLMDRHLYCETVLAVNMKVNDVVTDWLPHGLTKEQESTALFLRYLLGHGRSIDPRLLAKSEHTLAEIYPSAAPIRKQ